MSINIFNVRIDSVTKNEALQKARLFLSGSSQHSIYTPNPEMLMAARHDPSFTHVLNRSSLNLCDGFGIQLVTCFKLRRLTGVDFMSALCELAAEENKTIYLLGSASETVIDAAGLFLQTRSPNLKIVGKNKGPKIFLKKNSVATELLFENSEAEENEKILHDIILSAPDLLLVAFGHEKQERWIDTHLEQLPSVKIALGVGGAFDMLAGTIPRAPRLFRAVGLEWLWRLGIEPKRFSRIITAAILFPMYYAITKLKNTLDKVIAKKVSL